MSRPHPTITVLVLGPWKASRLARRKSKKLQCNSAKDEVILRIHRAYLGLFYPNITSLIVWYCGACVELNKSQSPSVVLLCYTTRHQGMHSLRWEFSFQYQLVLAVNLAMELINMRTYASLQCLQACLKLWIRLYLDIVNWMIESRLKATSWAPVIHSSTAQSWQNGRLVRLLRFTTVQSEAETGGSVEKSPTLEFQMIFIVNDALKIE